MWQGRDAWHPFAENEPRLPVGNALNMGLTLAVQATICRETGRPSVFPDSCQPPRGPVASPLAMAPITPGGMIAVECPAYIGGHLLIY